ncbi:hypothetical protein NQZ68_025460 [Dissostichus eleginoides]|nr:hypothetical protein NQZ68_025460 [Dissostichus eleginoides]
MEVTVWLPPPLPPSHLPSPGPCTCANGSTLLKNVVPKNQAVELIKRREKEFQQHKARTESVLSTRLYAPSNSPLQYPIQGFKVRPMTPTFIPVSKGVLRTTIPAARAKVQGNGESRLMMESSSLETLNELLANVSYTSTVYHIHTGDLASFQFEDHEAVFPITIKQPQPPVLYDMGTDVNSQVTITTKTFLRYPQLKVLLRSIRQFYKDIEVIIADDSFVTEKMTGDHIQHYIMPPGKLPPTRPHLNWQEMLGKRERNSGGGESLGAGQEGSKGLETFLEDSLDRGLEGFGTSLEASLEGGLEGSRTLS